MGNTSTPTEAFSVFQAIRATLKDVLWFTVVGPPIGGVVMSVLNYTTVFAIFGMAVLSPIAGAAPAALTGLGAAFMRRLLSGWPFRWTCGLLGMTTTYMLLTPQTHWASLAWRNWWDVSLLLSALAASVAVPVIQDAWATRRLAARVETLRATTPE